MVETHENDRSASQRNNLVSWTDAAMVKTPNRHVSQFTLDTSDMYNEISNYHQFKYETYTKLSLPWGLVVIMHYVEGPDLDFDQLMVSVLRAWLYDHHVQLLIAVPNRSFLELL